MRLTEEEIKDKFSSLDFDLQNIRQNRIYSKLNFNKEDRRYAMKKLIYAIGTVCIIGLLLIPVFKLERKIEKPETKQPIATPLQAKAEVKNTPAFVKENYIEQEDVPESVIDEEKEPEE